MKRSTKILGIIFILGLVIALIRSANSQGGGGLEDLLETLGYTTIVLFILSLIILIVNLNNLKHHFDTILVLILTFPMIYSVINNFFEERQNNRIPDLTIKYRRPVSEEQYKIDSIKLKIRIDSIIARKNRSTGGSKVLFTQIDTIIYSQSGDQFFVIYASKFETNDWGNDLNPEYLSGYTDDTLFLNLEKAPPRGAAMSASYHDFLSLKMDVRKYYFNRYKFEEKDSLLENYIWRRKEKKTTANTVYNP